MNICVFLLSSLSLDELYWSILSISSINTIYLQCIIDMVEGIREYSIYTRNHEDPDNFKEHLPFLFN